MKKIYSPTINEPEAIRDWIIAATKQVPTADLKRCSVTIAHGVRNKLFTTLGVAGGENPVLFGVPVKLVPGSSLDVTLEIPE